MIRLVTLGGLALLGENGAIYGAPGRGRNLALLVLVDRAGVTGIHRDKLAAWLWAESNQARARHSLDQALFTLRRGLGVDVFTSVSGGLGLDRSRIDSDVAAFLRAVEAGDLQSAVEIYGGPFLDGFHLSRAAEFERWVDVERAVMEGRYERALEARAREAAAGGDPSLAVEAWQRLATLRPLSSRVTLELMRALEEIGDRARALRAAGVHAALVREELDDEPESSILEYVDELRRTAAPAYSRLPPAGIPLPDVDGNSVALPLDAGSITRAQSRLGSRRGRRGTGWVALGVVAVVVIALVVQRRSPALADRPLVGVASFENLTGDPALEPIGRMAADWLEQGFARTGLVRVVGPGDNPKDAASVVEGRVYRVGDSLWLQARIRDRGSGEIVRSLDPVGTHVETPVRALEPLRQQALGALGTLYDTRVATWAAATLRPPTFEAYREFAAGIDRYGARDLSGMAEQFRRAVELDPDYLTAHLWLGWAASLMEDFETADSIVGALRRQRARMSPLERAWHDRQSALLRGDNQRAWGAAARMAEIAPGSGWTVALADAALSVNRPGDAVLALEAAGPEGLGPVRDHAAALLTFAYHVLGMYDRELALSDETIRAIGMDWDFVGPGVRALAALGRVDELEQRLAQLRHMPPTTYSGPRGPASLLAAAVELRAHGRADAAEAVVARALAAEREPGSGAREPRVSDVKVAVWPRVSLLYEMGYWNDAAHALDALPQAHEDFRRRAMAALLAARRGDTEAALAMDAELAQRYDRWLFGEVTVWRARIAAVLGENERAMRLLRQAFAEGQHSRLRWLLHTLRDFDELRKIPQFRLMYEGVGRD